MVLSPHIQFIMFNKLLSLPLSLHGVAHGLMISFLCGLRGQKGWTALMYSNKQQNSTVDSSSLKQQFTDDQ